MTFTGRNIKRFFTRVWNTMLGKYDEYAKWAANRLVELIKEQIESEGKLGGAPWSPLSPATMFLKGGRTTPLIDTGSLLNAFTVIKTGRQKYTVIGEHPALYLMEFGFSVRVTDQMRKWYLAQGMPLSGKTRFIVIPARPYIEPVVPILQAEAVGKSMELFGEPMGLSLNLNFRVRG